MPPYEGLSFSEKLKALRNSDPEFARSVARLRGAVIFLLAATGFVAAMTANIVNVGQGHGIRNVHNEVTRIQKTPCGKHPADPSKRCETLRQALAASESIVAECIAHQRVEGTRGRNCKRFYVDVDLDGAPELQRQGGDAQQTGSTGHQQPSPSPSGGGGKGTEAGKGGGSGGNEGGHAQGHPGGQNPAQTSPAPTSQGNSGSASADTGLDIRPPAGEAATPEPHPLPETVEAAGGAVGETGEAAQGVVESVGETACKVVACR